MRLDRVFFSHSRGLMSWHFTGAIGCFQRLRFVLLHTVQYPRYCTGYESFPSHYRRIEVQQSCGGAETMISPDRPTVHWTHQWAGIYGPFKDWSHGIIGPRPDTAQGQFGFGPKEKRAYSQIPYNEHIKGITPKMKKFLILLKVGKVQESQGEAISWGEILFNR